MPFTKQQITELLADKDFRDHFVADAVHELLSAQVKNLREAKHWNQTDLGNQAGGMEQGQVSRLENPDYEGGSLRSIIRLANAFDVALIVRFAPFSELVDWAVNLTPQRLAPPSFNEEQLQASPNYTFRINDSDLLRARVGGAHNTFTIEYTSEPAVFVQAAGTGDFWPLTEPKLLQVPRKELEGAIA